MKRLFHYTTKSRLKSILKTGVINLASLYVPDGVKPAAWFSYRQDWEQTATPSWVENGVSKQLTFKELVDIDSPARIEIDPQTAPINWLEYCKQSGERSRDLKALEFVAIHNGASVRDWRMSFEPVTIASWLAVELFFEGEWRDMSEFSKGG